MLIHLLKHVQYEDLPVMTGSLNDIYRDHIRSYKRLIRQIACRASVSGPVAEEADCPFSRWYHSDSVRVLRDDPQFNRLGEFHSRFISEAGTLIDGLNRSGEIRESAFDRFALAHEIFFQELQKLVDAFNQSACHFDDLTGLLNRRALKAQLQKEQGRIARMNRPGCIVFTDIDHFKAFNDTHGHAEGDQALKQVAKCLRESTRTYDLVARYGGEEFVLFLPETTLLEAEDVVERIRKDIARNPIALNSGERCYVTASFGIAELGKDGNIDKVMRAADTALYAAKQNGRNQVSLHPYSYTKPEHQHFDGSDTLLMSRHALGLEEVAS